ncbi:cell envelope integrity protein TolA [Undibacterium jejuense]|uniref:Cell envelope integrity protein TolA n=1 Tax=Undibacterium jejuense TaxID=1344949 RepID=A0A923KKG9_9BURK|nr:cell envelope integrity protein TolA [Undibacterium jejuense]MBC3861900.1 cell envelope integrity protein TolA [Undibacterium jejuense]
MNQVSIPGRPNFQQYQSGEGRAIALAIFVHLLLLGFLWVGIKWQNTTPTAVEAEVWDMTMREAAPLAVPVEPEPVPQPTIAPPPPVAKEEAPKEDPEIAIEQDKKRKLLEKQKEDERKQEIAQQQAEQKRKDQELQAKKEKEAEKQRLADKELEKQKQDKLDKQKLAEQKAQQAKEKAASDKLFQENMQRLSAQAGATGSGGNGTAARSTGNNRGDPSYVAKIAAKIRSNTNYNVSDAVVGNPAVDYQIDLLPDGYLRGPVRKLKSSGIPGFDDAVAKGIEKAQPFPRDSSGAAATSLVLHYKMKEE